MLENKFEVGDELVVVSNKCAERGYQNNYYYFGASLREIPLNSVGRLDAINVNSKAYKLYFEGVGSQWFRENEIEIADEIKQLKRILPEFESIGKHPLFELFDNSKVFLVDKKVYVLNEEQTGGEGENYFGDGELRLMRDGGYATDKKSVDYLGDLVFFDELMMSRYCGQISSVGKNFADKFKKKILSCDFVDKEISLPYKIFKEVLPYFRKANYDDKISSLFGMEEMVGGGNISEVKFEKNKIEQLDVVVDTLIKEVEKSVAKINAEDFSENLRQKLIDELLSGSGQTSVENESCLLEKLLEGRNLAIIDKNVYDLVLADNSSGMQLNLGDRKYGIKKSSLSMDELEKEYKIQLGKKIRLDVFKNEFSKEKIALLANKLKKKISEDFGFNELIQKGEYSEEDFGVLRRVNSYYVYLKLPSFAIKSIYDNQCYFFEKTRIGCGLNIYDNKLQVNPCVMFENNHHPILHTNGGDFAGLCRGYNEFPYGKNTGETVAMHLRKYKDIIMYGYLRGTGFICEQFKNCSRCDKNHYANHIRSLEELKAKGIQIIEPSEKQIEPIKGSY